MDFDFCSFLAGGLVVAVSVALFFVWYRRGKKYYPGESERQERLEAIAILSQLKMLLAEEDNKEMADRLAGSCGDYVVPDCEKAKTQEEATALRREMTQLEDYISVLGLCGMLYKTGMVTHTEMYSLIGERTSDILENRQLYDYLREYQVPYTDVLFLLRYFP